MFKIQHVDTFLGHMMYFVALSTIGISAISMQFANDPVDTIILTFAGAAMIAVILLLGILNQYRTDKWSN